jgi:hypothetical protein
MNFDISPLLDGWEYRAGEITVRKFKGKDGAEKIQLRVDLGLLQMNATGRPDGRRPFGHESLLEHHEARLAKHVAEHEGSSEGFVLDAEDCSKLLQEAIQYHHRYICLFQLHEYEEVILNTQRNLRAFHFVDEFAATEEMSWSLQQFCPQLLMMETRARGSLALQRKDTSGAVQAVTQGLESIREFYRDYSKPDACEQSGEIQSLESWLKELQDQAAARRPKRSLSAREKLETALNEAVLREDYELAAKYRDSLRNLKTSPDA